MKANGAFLTSGMALLSLVAPLTGNPDGSPSPEPSAGTVEESGVVETPPDPRQQASALIPLLADEDFRTREKATRDLWQLGDAALETLREAASGIDPEAAVRARDLLRKIELQITPDTDPAVIDLVERYTKATRGQKGDLFAEMRQKRAFRQMLKLFAGETDPTLREELTSHLRGVAVLGARELILRNDPAAAREFLELAQVDPQSLLSLASFHRGQGTLDAELEAARISTAKGAAAWRTALHRAAGNLIEAADAATEAGEPSIAAAMRMLDGEPIPWMSLPLPNRRSEDASEVYLECAARRWLGKSLRKTDLEPLDRLTQSRNVANRWTAISTLYLLGEVAMGEQTLVKTSPFDSFLHFETLERIPEALKALGLDPANPDFTAWAKERFDSILEDPDESDDAQSQLVTIASFLERRGLFDELAAAYDDPLDRLAKEDEETFTSFLSTLFGTSITGSGAISPSKRAGIAWAGDDEDRWNEVLIAAFGEEDELTQWWEWLAELDPDASRADRLDAMLAIFAYGNDPKKLRRQWLRLAWNAIDRTPADQREPLLLRILYAATSTGDSINTLKAAEQLPEDQRDTYITDEILADAGRWQEAADRFLARIDRITQSASSRVRPEYHAYAASALRRVGLADQAAIQDEWVEKLALGDASINLLIADGYRFGGDFTRAALWTARAAREASPPSNEFYRALKTHSEDLFQSGDWLRSASTAEAFAHIYSGSDNRAVSRFQLLRMRLHADLPRALHLLETDREAAIEILGQCHAFFPNDGSLADDFFPALRKVGLITEHDSWFEDSWKRIAAVIEQYPNSDNSRNSAAWLASRANRRLDEAELHQKEALALNPDQPAYLDTLAEIHFARGDRKKAVAASKRAVQLESDSDSRPILRQQYFRFLEGPFPNP